MQDKSYVIVSISINDQDEPVRKPEDVARDIALLGIRGVVETRPAFSDGQGVYWPYGASEVAL